MQCSFTQCTPELESLTIKCRTLYLFKEIQSLIMTVAYIPPDFNVEPAIDQLSALVKRHSGIVSIVSGDIIHTDLLKRLPNLSNRRKMYGSLESLTYDENLPLPTC